MKIREDEPLSVDQEAAAGALARPFEVPLTVGVVRRTPRPLLLADRSRRGGVHVHDGRVDALRNVGEVDDRGTGKPGGLRTANRPAVRESPRRSRHERPGGELAGDDQADEKRHDGNQGDGQDGESAHVTGYSIISALN